jgi:trk system potassium uptake protein TrkA
MKVLIMGCGRVGALLATLLDKEGHKVTVLDTKSYSFGWLPTGFTGTALLGHGLDEVALKKAEIESTDVFIAVTQGGNRNIMACEIAKHIFNVPKVVCRIYDPLRRDIFSKLGLEAISPTTISAQMLKEKVEG